MAGCGDSDSGATKVVILDLQAVARALGRDQELKIILEAAQNTLLQQLEQIRGAAQKQLDEEKKKVGEKPSDEQNKQLATLGGQLQQGMNSKINEANSKFAQYKVGLVEQFKSEVKPVALKIAKDRGAGVILLPAEQVFAAEPASDITTEVITQLKTTAKPWLQQAPAGTAPAAAPAPAPAPAAPAATTPAPAAPAATEPAKEEPKKEESKK
jgi:Skp family chaperone for outer membrane proteins